MTGPGDMLKALYSPFYRVDCDDGESRRKCDCCEIADDMNRWGPDECLKRSDELTNRILDSARQLGILQWPGRKSAKAMIRQTIRLAVLGARIAARRSAS